MKGGYPGGLEKGPISMHTAPEKRRFVRHPVSVPLEYVVLPEGGNRRDQVSRDLSRNGISFPCTAPPPVGARLLIRIRVGGVVFEVEGRVVRIAREERGWLVGVAFDSTRAWYRARMVEQICHIEAWRKSQEEKGRRLTFSQAAEEWIRKKASSFPPAVP